jgi:hypothetical protein
MPATQDRAKQDSAGQQLGVAVAGERTLFARAGQSPFREVLLRYSDGAEDRATLQRL